MMINEALIAAVKRSIDELTDEELLTIRDYCEQNAIQIHYQKENEYKKSIFIGVNV